MSDLSDRILELEKQVQGLTREVMQTRFQLRLMRSLVSSDLDPFTHLVLEHDLSQLQMDAIFKLMDDVWLSIQPGRTPMSHVDFEERVYDVVPGRGGDYHFAEDVVATLCGGDRYRGVYQFMKQNGMNLP